LQQFLADAVSPASRLSATAARSQAGADEFHAATYVPAVFDADPDRSSSKPSGACGPTSRPGGLPPWRIRRLVAFVQQHLSQPIRIADLSALVGLSIPQLSRAFRQSFGAPPHVYLIRQRLDRARHLMLASDIALSEVAVACGFTDQAHFCNLFRRHTGRTPAAWRRERRDAIRRQMPASAPVPFSPGRNQDAARPELPPLPATSRKTRIAAQGEPSLPPVLGVAGLQPRAFTAIVQRG
jgi:AraC-like DNA-binding protein